MFGREKRREEKVAALGVELDPVRREAFFARLGERYASTEGVHLDLDAHTPLLERVGVRFRTVLGLAQLVAVSPDEFALFGGGEFPPEAMIERAGAASVAWREFRSAELGFLLNRGLRPPIAEGFARALAVDEAIVAQPGSRPPSLAASMAGLLRDLDVLEVELLRHELGPQQADALRPVRWDALAGEVVADQREMRARVGTEHGSLTVAEAGDVVAAPEAHRALVLAAADRDLDGPEEVGGVTMLGAGALFVMRALVGAALADAGFESEREPGRRQVFQIGGERFDPAGELDGALRSGDATAWRARAAALGVDDLPLLDG